MPAISVIPWTSRPPHKCESITWQPVVSLPTHTHAPLHNVFIRKQTTLVPWLARLDCSRCSSNAVEGVPPLGSAVFDSNTNTLSISRLESPVFLAKSLAEWVSTQRICAKPAVNQTKAVMQNFIFFCAWTFLESCDNSWRNSQTVQQVIATKFKFTSHSCWRHPRERLWTRVVDHSRKFVTQFNIIIVHLSCERVLGKLVETTHGNGYAEGNRMNEHVCTKRRERRVLIRVTGWSACRCMSNGEMLKKRWTSLARV